MKGKKIAGILVLVLVIAAMLVAFFAFREKSVEGHKDITIEVVMPDETSTVYEVSTDAEYLIGAMDDADGLTYEAEEGPYGLSVNVINGVDAALDSGTAYWGFFIGDEYCNYGVSQQPVEDGDAFRIVYTVMP